MRHAARLFVVNLRCQKYSYSFNSGNSLRIMVLVAKWSVCIIVEKRDETEWLPDRSEKRNVVELVTDSRN